MIGSVFVFAAVAPLAITALPAPAHPAPYDELPKPYGFEYGVHDRYTHPKSYVIMWYKSYVSFCTDEGQKCPKLIYKIKHLT